MYSFFFSSVPCDYTLSTCQTVLLTLCTRVRLLYSHSFTGRVFYSHIVHSSNCFFHTLPSVRLFIQENILCTCQTLIPSHCPPVRLFYSHILRRQTVLFTLCPLLKLFYSHVVTCQAVLPLPSPSVGVFDLHFVHLSDCFPEKQ